MDEGMIDLMAGDVILRERLQAYAEARLTPDVATSARIRARVLAVAHRRAELARADAALTVVRDVPVVRPTAAGRRHGRWQRAMTAVLVAGLAAGAGAGTALAAKPGGAFYGARLWAETLTLPSEPSKRALAELERLEHRLAEASEAIRAGDIAGATAALDAYSQIVDTASSETVAAGDDVAIAALKTGVARNVEVLERLVTSAPATAADAITRALTRALDRTDGAIRDIDRGNAGGNGGQPDGRPGGPAPKPTKAPEGPGAAPTPKPTPRSDNGGTNNGNAGNGSGGNNGNGPGGNNGNGPGGPQSTDHPAQPEHPAKPTPEPGQD